MGAERGRASEWPSEGGVFLRQIVELILFNKKGRQRVSAGFFARVAPDEALRRAELASVPKMLKPVPAEPGVFPP